MTSDGLMIVSITDLMREAGAAHGAAFEGANGKNPDWLLRRKRTGRAFTLSISSSDTGVQRLLIKTNWRCITHRGVRIAVSCVRLLTS